VTELVREMAARVRSAVSPAPCWAGLHPWPRHVERPVHRRARPPLLRHAPELERAASGIGRRARLEGLVHLLREDGVEHELASALPPVDPSRVLLFSDRPHQLTATSSRRSGGSISGASRLTRWRVTPRAPRPPRSS
jgi:hypothetical protein